MLFRFANKLNYLRQHYPESALTAASLSLSRAIEKTIAPNSTPSGTLHAMVIDTLYALLRHRRWITTQLFQEIFVDFMASDYREAGRPLEGSYSSLVDEIASHFPLHATQPPSDADFMRSILVASACSANEATLEIELGLGKNFLGRLRTLTHSALLSKGTGSTAVYGTAHEALIADVMRDLANSLRRTPHLMDILRLENMISEFLPAGAENSACAHVAFRCLMKAAATGSMSLSRFEKSWFSYSTKGSSTNISAKQVIEALDRGGVVFQQAQEGRLFLTQIGREIVADAHASKVLVRHPPTQTELESLHPAFQASVIRRWPETHLRTLQEIVESSALRFSPQGLAELVAKLANCAPSENLAQRLVTLSASHELPRIRAGACLAMGHLKLSGEVGQDSQRWQNQMFPKPCAMRRGQL